MDQIDLKTKNGNAKKFVFMHNLSRRRKEKTRRKSI